MSFALDQGCLFPGLKTGSIDSMVPETKEDFEAFAKAICDKIRFFSTSDHYSELIEAVSKDLALDSKFYSR